MATKKTILPNDLSNASLMDLLSDGSSKGVFSTNSMIDYSYQTGITILDHVFGYETNVRDESGKVIKKRKCLGLQAGTFNVVTGYTQSYKTTITVQAISKMGYRYGGNIVHYDCENRLVLERVKLLTKLPDNWFVGNAPRYSLRCGAIGFDTLQNDITEIYKNKMKHRDVLLRDTGEVDANNKPIYLMPPTFIFVDSLQNLIAMETSYDVDNKKFDDNRELRSNMAGAQNAKTTRGLLTDIVPMLKEANIMLIVIAHKTANMSPQPFMVARKQFHYGSASERMSGGSAVEFNAAAVINLTGGKDDYHESTDGFEGNAVLFEPTKSSSNESGNSKTGMGYMLVVDKRKEGVDNVRSLILFLQQKNRLKGNKAGFKVIDKQGNEISNKFTWKTCYEDFQKDKETYRAFMVTCKEELDKLVAPAPDVSGQISVFDIDAIVNDFDNDQAA